MVQEKGLGLCGGRTFVKSSCRVVLIRESQASVELVQLWNPVAGWYRRELGLWGVGTYCGIPLQDGTGERAGPLWS